MKKDITVTLGLYRRLNGFRMTITTVTRTRRDLKKKNGTDLPRKTDVIDDTTFYARMVLWFIAPTKPRAIKKVHVGILWVSLINTSFFFRLCRHNVDAVLGQQPSGYVF